MRCLNEHIARKANAEDRCKGRFWESRFTVQALLDETAVLACMAYVDLNPIRAAMANCPENSDFTSLQERLGITPTPERTASIDRSDEPAETGELASLMPFSGAAHESNAADHLPFAFPDYLELVEWTGRAVRSDKRGSIPGHLPGILHRLGIEPHQWLRTSSGVEQHFYGAIGPVATLEQFVSGLASAGFMEPALAERFTLRLPDVTSSIPIYCRDDSDRQGFAPPNFL